MHALVLAAAATGLSALGAAPASAAVTFDYGTNVPQTDNPDTSVDCITAASCDPWLTAVITDITGGVQIALKTGSNVKSNNFFSELFFNLNPLKTFTIPSTAFSCTPGTGYGCVPFSGTYSANSIAGGYGTTPTFDMKINLGGNGSGGPTQPNRLNGGGETALLKILASNLTAADFEYGNPPCPPDPKVPGKTSCWTTIAKVQGLVGGGSFGATLGGGGGGQGGNDVPGPLPLLGAASAFGFSRKLRARIKSSRQAASYTL